MTGDTMTPAVHVLVFDGFADWEAAFAMAELRRSGGLEVVTLGFSEAPVRSMGGLPVVPDRPLKGLNPAAVRLLILPGGDLWEGSHSRAELEPTLLRAMTFMIVASPCAGTSR